MAAGLLAGIQARVQRPEYARLLSDCQILYCDTRLQLVNGVTHDAILHMSSEPLPILARDGWAYLMQVWLLHSLLLSTQASGAPGCTMVILCNLLSLHALCA